MHANSPAMKTTLDRRDELLHELRELEDQIYPPFVVLALMQLRMQGESPNRFNRLYGERRIWGAIQDMGFPQASRLDQAACYSALRRMAELESEFDVSDHAYYNLKAPIAIGS